MRRFILAIMIILLSQSAWAHKPSDSYMSLTFQEAQISGQWDIALRDLNDAIGLDTDDDGAISWGEVRTKHADIASYAFSRLKLRSSESICPIAIGINWSTIIRMAPMRSYNSSQPVQPRSTT